MYYDITWGLFNYIDDLLYTGLSSEILLDLLQELGLDISHKKLVSPATSVICLGILVDSVNKTICQKRNYKKS